jgi:oligopeptide transport system substrate-binding protein
MNKLALSFITTSFVLLMSCEINDNSQSEIKNSKTKEISCLDFAITEKYQTLDPVKITDITSFEIAAQVMEPLLRFSEKDLTLVPVIANYWEISDDNLVYTFKIKEGVYFQDNSCFKNGKGRELTANDIVYSFKRICSEKSSYGYSLFKNLIQGSENYTEGEIEGLKAIDTYTIEFTLNKPYFNFLNLLGGVNSCIVAKEAIEQNEIVGTGPFIYSKENETAKTLTLLRNKNYHMSDDKGNKLPYLESVAFHHVKSPQEHLEMFMNGELDLVRGIPHSSLKDLVSSQISDFENETKKYVLGRYPEVVTSYLTLNTSIAPFDNKKIRQALGMAINKAKIVENVLKGEAFSPGYNGIVPSAIKGYDFSSVVGLEFNLVKAKALLAEEGYPEGKGFPTITLASLKRNKSTRVSLEIQKQLLANLNINVELSSLTLKDMTEMNGKSELNMSLGGWLGEFPDPVSFLSLFYGGDVPSSPLEMSYPNEARYKNKTFDEIYKKALVTIDDSKRYELCLQADQIIATDAPCIPLWYHENYQLVKSNITGYQANSMNIKYLTYVKFQEPVTK